MAENKPMSPAEASYWAKIRAANILPADDLIYVDPDFIDRFVDYLIGTGVDLYTFQNSSARYRAETYNRWFRSLPDDQRQLGLF